MMGLLVKLLGGSVGPYIAGAIGAVVLLAVGAATVQTLRLDHAKADLGKCHEAFAAEQAAYRAEQAAYQAVLKQRGQDHKDAVADANQSQSLCNARVAAARRTAGAIHDLLNTEPSHAPPDPREPELIPGDQLWRATGR